MLEQHDTVIEDEKNPVRGVYRHDANKGRVVGQAKTILVRSPRSGYSQHRCVFCRQELRVGTLAARQDRWLWEDKNNRWYAPGYRHINCWELENKAVSTVRNRNER